MEPTAFDYRWALSPLSRRFATVHYFLTQAMLEAYRLADEVPALPGSSPTAESELRAFVRAMAVNATAWMSLVGELGLMGGK